MGEKLRELKNYESTNSLFKKLRENHDTIQRLTSQMRELQERVNCLSDSGEFQVVDSNYSGKILTFPVNQQSFQVHVLC